MNWRAGLRRLQFERLVNALARRLLADARNVAPRSIDLPPGSRMLVLAPHPDDESIGCGGTLARWRQAGRTAKVLFLTDGRLGSRDLRALPEQDPRRVEGERQMVEIRRQEARRALEILAVNEFAYADAPDGQLWQHVEPVAKEIARTIEEDRPDLILLPFMTDAHADHMAANACLLSALRQVDAARLKGMICAGYEVWSPIQANTLIDITVALEQKRAAIGVYISQLRDTNYLDGAVSLNRFRAISNLLPGTHAEAFFLAPAKTYMELIAA